MTVPAACKALREYLDKRLEAGLTGARITIQDIFPDSQDTAFTEELYRDLQTTIADPQSDLNKFLGTQEGLAFLGSIQRADKLRKTTRVGRLASKYAQKKSISDSSDGALALQLSAIGSKVDSEFIADMGVANGTI